MGVIQFGKGDVFFCFQWLDEARRIVERQGLPLAGQNPEYFVASRFDFQTLFSLSVGKVDEQIDFVFVGIGKDRGKGCAAPIGIAFLQVADGTDVIDFFYLVIAFDDRDFHTLGLDDVQYFFHGLMELGITDAAAHVEGDEDACLVMMEFSPQVKAVRLAAAETGRRVLGAARQRAGHTAQIPVPGQGRIFALDSGDSTAEMRWQIALIGFVEILFREFDHGLRIGSLCRFPQIMGMDRVELGLVGIGDLVGCSRLILFLPVDAALNLFGIVFQRVVRCQVELILAVDAFDGHAVGRYGVEVRIDDGIHGQIEGQLAVRATKVTGTQEMAEHDVQDFVTD